MAETRLLCVTTKECTTLNELDENSRIAVSVLMEDGWSIYRVGLHGEVTLSAVPYLTVDQHAEREAALTEREALLVKQKSEIEGQDERVNRMLLRHRNRVRSFFGTVVYLALLLTAKILIDLHRGSHIWASEAVVLAWLFLTDIVLYATQFRNR